MRDTRISGGGTDTTLLTPQQLKIALFVLVALAILWIVSHDMAKQVIATTIGAGLAFFSNRLFEAQRQEKKDITSGNMALMILGRQYGDFQVAKKAALQEAEEKKQFPEWMRLNPPLSFAFSDSLRFNMDSLAFLVDGESQVLRDLVDVETSYQETGKLLLENGIAAEARHKAIAAAGITDGTPADLHRFEQAVAVDLKEHLRHLYEALVERRLKRHEEKYARARDSLQAALFRKFPKAHASGAFIEFTAYTPRD